MASASGWVPSGASAATLAGHFFGAGEVVVDAFTDGFGEVGGEDCHTQVGQVGICREVPFEEDVVGALEDDVRVFFELRGAVHFEGVEQVREGCDVLFEGVALEDLAGNREHFGFHACVFTGNGEVAFFEDAVEVLVHAGDQYVIYGGEVVEDGAAGDACAFCECFCVEGAVAALEDEGFCCLNDCDTVLCLAGGNACPRCLRGIQQD